MAGEMHTRDVAVSVVMPTIDFAGTFETCARRALDLMDASPLACELVVALDGPEQPRPTWLERPGVTVIATGRRSGPAVARNRAASAARGGTLLFVDADVALAEGTIERAHEALAADAGLAAVFGAYDDNPPHPGVVSRFKNLLHHYTHSTHPGATDTFWAGCGAMRRSVFESLGGFLASYSRPSVEDIELGMRATAAGHRIEIDPRLRCTHLKRWTLASMVVTDIAHRAMPWSRLVLGSRTVPRTLNIDLRGRASGACAAAAALALALAPVFPLTLAVAAALVIAVVSMNAGFFALCASRGGLAFACACVPLYLLYLLYSTVTFAAVVAVRHPLPALLAAYLAAVAVTSFTAGSVGMLTQGMDGDLQARATEYAAFREGRYPHERMDPAPRGQQRMYSVYMPYAFAMFTAIFEPFGLMQARIMVIALSAAALVVIGLYGSRLLAPHGLVWSAVGGLAAAGITINRSTLAQGQFAIICMGFITLQIVLLQRGRPLLAGACWAMAMLKPHVGIAFAALFLLNRQWRGLAFGMAILVALTAAALWWTGVPFSALANEWLSGTAMQFTAEPEGLSLGKLSQRVGWNHRMVQAVALAAVLTMLGAIAFALRKVTVANLLVPAALCALMGRLLLYHRPYDQVMLYPALLAGLSVALALRTKAAIAVAAMLALTLWVPLRLQYSSPVGEAIQIGLWCVAGAYFAFLTLSAYAGPRGVLRRSDIV